MTDTGEEHESVSTPLEEPIEEVQVSEEAQQIAIIRAKDAKVAFTA